MPSGDETSPPGTRGASGSASAPSRARICTCEPSRVTWLTTEDLNSGSMLPSSLCASWSTAPANSAESARSRSTIASASDSAASPDETPPTRSTNASISVRSWWVTFFACQK